MERLKQLILQFWPLAGMIALVLIVGINLDNLGLKGAADGQKSSLSLPGIEDVKIKWLKPISEPDGTVILRWEEPYSYLIKKYGLEKIQIKVIEPRTLKPIGKVYASIFETKSPYKFPKVGKFRLEISASTLKGLSTGTSSFVYTFRQYVPPLSPSKKDAVVESFYSYMENYKDAFKCTDLGCEKSKVQQLEKVLWNWANKQKNVSKIRLQRDYWAVAISFDDNSVIHARLNDFVRFTPGEEIELANGNPQFPYSDDPFGSSSRMPLYQPPVKTPTSNRALVVHGLGDSEMGVEYRFSVRSAIETGARAAGFDDITTILPNDEHALETLKRMDDEQYGLIYYLHHGGLVELDEEEHFGVGIPPYYDQEPEINHIGVGVATQRIDGVRKYHRYFTRLFVDMYMGDVRFPDSFIFWFSCGSSHADTKSREMYASLYNKGVTTGWVGMNAPRALIATNIDSTRNFFFNLEKVPYLGQAVTRAVGGTGGNLALINPLMSRYNRVLYMDRDFVDLGIRSIQQAPDRMLRVRIGNEGTLTAEAGTEFSLGTMSWEQDEEFHNVARAVIPEDLEQGSSFSLLVPIDVGDTDWLAIDIDEETQDNIRANNKSPVDKHLNGFLADLIVSDHQVLDEETLQISITNHGLMFARNVEGFDADYFLDLHFDDENEPERLQIPLAEGGLNEGETYQLEFDIPPGASQATIWLDSTNLIEEYDEDNRFVLNLND